MSVRLAPLPVSWPENVTEYLQVVSTNAVLSTFFTVQHLSHSMCLVPFQGHVVRSQYYKPVHVHRLRLSLTFVQSHIPLNKGHMSKWRISVHVNEVFITTKLQHSL